MSSRPRMSMVSLVPIRKSRFRKPTSRELDLLLLAGCSCLMTFLYHPVAEALQTAQSSSGSSAAIATTTSKTAANSMNSFHLVASPSRDDRQDEEEG